ncbi:MAG: prepilin-type N-terminal cleavage/methylation domain-containing protein, partial [Clostridium sp.]
KLKKRRKGFTLIEMVVVIAIVVIIAAIAIPQALKAINKSKASTDIANARTVAGEVMTKVADGSAIADAITAAPQIKSKVDTANNLAVTADADGNGVIVKVGTAEIYPNVTGNWKTYTGQ